VCKESTLDKDYAAGDAILLRSKYIMNPLKTYVSRVAVRLKKSPMKHTIGTFFYKDKKA